MSIFETLLLFALGMYLVCQFWGMYDRWEIRNYVPKEKDTPKTEIDDQHAVAKQQLRANK